MFRTILCLLFVWPVCTAFAAAPVIEVVLPDHCPKGFKKKTRAVNPADPFVLLAPDDRTYIYPNPENPFIVVPEVQIRKMSTAVDIRTDKASKTEEVWYAVYQGKVVPAAHIVIEKNQCFFRKECKGSIVETLQYKEDEKLYLFFTKEEAEKFAMSD